MTTGNRYRHLCPFGTVKSARSRFCPSSSVFPPFLQLRIPSRTPLPLPFAFAFAFAFAFRFRCLLFTLKPADDCPMSVMTSASNFLHVNLSARRSRSTMTFKIKPSSMAQRFPALWNLRVVTSSMSMSPVPQAIRRGLRGGAYAKLETREVGR